MSLLGNLVLGLGGRLMGGENGEIRNSEPYGAGLSAVGGLLGTLGSVFDIRKQNRAARRSMAALQPFTDPLYGFRESRGMLEAANQMGTANLAQLAQRMGGSQGAAQATGAAQGAQAMTNAYLGALESGRNMAFQATQARNAMRPTQSALGSVLGQAGGFLSSLGGGIYEAERGARYFGSGSRFFNYTPQEMINAPGVGVNAPDITGQEPYSARIGFNVGDYSISNPYYTVSRGRSGGNGYSSVDGRSFDLRYDWNNRGPHDFVQR